MGWLRRLYCKWKGHVLTSVVVPGWTATVVENGVVVREPGTVPVELSRCTRCPYRRYDVRTGDDATRTD